MYKTYWLLCLCLFCKTLAASEGACEEEILFLNRIADFWEEEEYKIAKSQIEEFLQIYPDSAFSDSLCSAIGDLLVRENNYSAALDYYAKVKDPETLKRIFPHKMQCLYSMQSYSLLADACEAFLNESVATDAEEIQITYYLASALYHQCVSEKENSETLLLLANRAEPYFETLWQTPLKQDLSTAFAHLLCILKKFPKAADIYLDLAKEENRDKMLFQAALIQAEYDKELALETFKKIEDPLFRQETAYNCLVLAFDLGKYEEILDAQETLSQTLSSNQLGTLHLLVGRSHCALQKYPEACASFAAYLATEPKESPTLEAAFLSYLDAATRAEDLDSLCKAVEKMEAVYPNHGDLAKGKLSKATLLAKQGKPSEAKQELENLLSQTQNEEILCALIHLNAEMKDWVSCRNHALLYLSLFEPTSVVKQSLVNASSEMATNSEEGKSQFVADLEILLEKEKNPVWQWDLAKTLFALRKYEKALSLLSNMPENGETFLLIALCYRDGFQDLQNFTHFGEKAISIENGSLDRKALHTALYNAYLDMERLDCAETHLFAAFQLGEKIDAENIAWLAKRYASQHKFLEAISLLESIPKESQNEETLFLLSQFYSSTEGQEDKGVSSLQELLALYEEAPHENWQHKNEALLLLANIYAGSGKTEEAKELLDRIIQQKSNLKTYFGACASLQSARLQAKKWDLQEPSSEDLSFQQVLSQLKDLVLQKNIVHEPIYLEAALDYIDLQSKSPEGKTKKLALLQKMKRDFENTEDLLSKDYHTARNQLQNQDLIYQSYMQFLDAEILIQENEQKELQAKAKDILLKIVEEKVHPALVARANQCLNQ